MSVTETTPQKSANNVSTSQPVTNDWLKMEVPFKNKTYMVKMMSFEVIVGKYFMMTFNKLFSIHNTC